MPINKKNKKYDHIDYSEIIPNKPLNLVGKLQDSFTLNLDVEDKNKKILKKVEKVQDISKDISENISGIEGLSEKISKILDKKDKRLEKMKSSIVDVKKGNENFLEEFDEVMANLMQAHGKSKKKLDEMEKQDKKIGKIIKSMK